MYAGTRTGKRRRRAPRFLTLIGSGSLIAVIVLAVLIDTAAYHHKVHAGVSVTGIDLGGKTKEEAITSVTRLVDEARTSPITLTAGEKTWTLMPDEAGTSMDVEGAVKAALAVTRKSNFFADVGTRWKLYFSPADLPLSGSVDTGKLNAFVAGIARELDVEPVNASLSMKDGKISVIKSREGQAVDQASLARQLSDLLVTLHSTTVEVPIVVTEPAVKAEDNRAAEEQAETMISGPVTVTSGDKKWTLAADEIASFMSFKSEMQNGVSTLVPYMDASRLEPLLKEITPAVLKKATSATFDHDNSRAWVVAGKNGTELDAEATAQAIAAATLEPTDRTVKVVTKVLEPDLTTEEAKARGINDKLSSYTTPRYTGTSERRTNVKMATKYATNVFLAPGEEYDFDKKVGPRTEERGFEKAPGIVGAGKLEDVYGGGICQVSTTMFNAVAGGKAGLKITERWNHSLYISHYPKGRDATVTDGGKNLRFVNDTKHYIWITGTSNGIETTITVWGTDQGRSTEWSIGDFYDEIPMTKTSVTDPTLAEGKTSVLDNGQMGRSLKTTRVVTENGKVIHRDVWTNRWPMYPAKIAVGTATTTTSTTAPPTTSTTAPPTTGAPTSTTTTTTAGE